MRHSVRGVVATCVGLWSLLALGEVRSGEVVEIRADEVVDGDLYLAAARVIVLGRVTGDLVAVGSSIDVQGTVEGDLLAASGELSVSGEVLGSIRAAAGQLSIPGRVGQDAAVAGGQLELGPGARLGNDLLAAVGSAQVSAPVGGSIWAAAGELALRNEVEGDVRATVDRLRLDEGARIGGQLSYRSSREAELAPGATVAGPINREIQPGQGGQRVAWAALMWVRSMVAFFALGLLLVLIFPTFTRRSVAALTAAPWRSLGIGFAVVFGTPALAVLVVMLGALFGGWWLGLLLLAIYAVALAVSFAVIGFLVGQWLFGRLRKPGASPILVLLVGVALLTLAIRVPVLGALVALAAVLFGAGAVIVAGAQGHRAAV